MKALHVAMTLYREAIGFTRLLSCASLLLTSGPEVDTQ